MTERRSHMDLEDITLWNRARGGDTAAFAELFERHASTIYNYCFRRIGSWTTAEDLVSIVFLEAWRRRDTQLAPDKVLPWLYGVATNVIRNRRRSERRFAAAIRRLPRPSETPDFAGDVADRLDDQQRMRTVLALLATLSASEQDVIALCVWSGLSYEEAAAALAIPVGTVRSRLSRARLRLQELTALSGHEEDARETRQEAVEP
jgi:RNA polymerase sigma factor (sigma-70 family)